MASDPSNDDSWTQVDRRRPKGRPRSRKGRSKPRAATRTPTPPRSKRSSATQAVASSGRARRGRGTRRTKSFDATDYHGGTGAGGGEHSRPSRRPKARRSARRSDRGCHESHQHALLDKVFEGSKLESGVVDSASPSSKHADVVRDVIKGSGLVAPPSELLSHRSIPVVAIVEPDEGVCAVLHVGEGCTLSLNLEYDDEGPGSGHYCLSIGWRCNSSRENVLEVENGTVADIVAALVAKGVRETVWQARQLAPLNVSERQREVILTAEADYSSLDPREGGSTGSPRDSTDHYRKGGPVATLQDMAEQFAAVDAHSLADEAVRPLRTSFALLAKGEADVRHPPTVIVSEFEKLSRAAAAHGILLQAGESVDDMAIDVSARHMDGSGGDEAAMGLASDRREEPWTSCADLTAHIVTFRDGSTYDVQQPAMIVAAIATVLSARGLLYVPPRASTVGVCFDKARSGAIGTEDPGGEVPSSAEESDDPIPV